MGRHNRWYHQTILYNLLLPFLMISGYGSPVAPHVMQKSLMTGIQYNEKTTNPMTVTVDAIGGSMAFGWKDPHNNSYLQRAFIIRSRHTHVHYKYINHGIPGFTAKWLNQKYPGQYKAWLTNDQPQVVVLSWGLENDMSSLHRDSLQTFAREMKQEISIALEHHAVVLIVTPPVTKLLATKDRYKVLRYINREFEVGHSFHNTNVVTINLYKQFKGYMNLHHQTCMSYYGNAWHPNQKGHKLAGKILASALEKKFGKGTIDFKIENSHLQAFIKNPFINLNNELK